MKIFKTRKGKTFAMLNPAEKARKYASELKHNVQMTNLGEVKTNDKGKDLKLNKRQRAWRAGYLGARSDNAAAYKANLKKATKAQTAVVAVTSDNKSVIYDD